MYHDPDILAMWILGALSVVAFALVIGIVGYDLIDEVRRKRRKPLL